MTTALAPVTAQNGRPPAPAQAQAQADAALGTAELALVQGDLSRLTPEERLVYYRKVCESLGLNPLTQPFDYVNLSGKLRLYARKDCAEQLRKRDGITLEIVSQQIAEEVVMVHVRARTPSGRADEDVGAVSLQGLKGEARSNAVLKAVTKAKRRVTLSICGLGFLDETEVEHADQPAYAQQQVVHQPAAQPLAQPAQPSAPVPPAAQPQQQPRPGKATEAQLNDLRRLRAELQIDAAAWAGILAKRQVTTALDLTPDQAGELLGRLKHRAATTQLEQAMPAGWTPQAPPLDAGLEVALPPNKQEAGGESPAGFRPPGFRE